MLNSSQASKIWKTCLLLRCDSCRLTCCCRERLWWLSARSRCQRWLWRADCEVRPHRVFRRRGHHRRFPSWLWVSFHPWDLNRYAHQPKVRWLQSFGMSVRLTNCSKVRAHCCLAARRQLLPFDLSCKGMTRCRRCSANLSELHFCSSDQASRHCSAYIDLAKPSTLLVWQIFITLLFNKYKISQIKKITFYDNIV